MKCNEYVQWELIVQHARALYVVSVIFAAHMRFSKPPNSFACCSLRAAAALRMEPVPRSIAEPTLRLTVESSCGVNRGDLRLRMLYGMRNIPK